MTEFGLKQRLQRLEAVHEIQNLVGRYAYFHVANMHEECCKLSALNTPGVRVEAPNGIYEGREGVERLYRGFSCRPGGSVGSMHMITMTTPVIEIAEDLKTAKDVWICPGHATDKYGGEKFQAKWRWIRLGCDFVREEGRWKIWHLHIYGIFATPFEKSWVENQHAGAAGPPPSPPEYGPDRPSNSFWQYSQNACVPNEPAPPETYSSFDETFAY